MGGRQSQFERQRNQETIGHHIGMKLKAHNLSEIHEDYVLRSTFASDRSFVFQHSVCNKKSRTTLEE